MEFNNISPNIVSRILDQLVEFHGAPDKTLEVRRSLLMARLVCRKWNTLATRRLYHTIKLVPRQGISEDEDEFKSWNKILDNAAARTAAQRVIIRSCPDNLSHDKIGDLEVWDDWKKGKYPGFTSAISRIVELPNIEALELHFSEACHGRDLESWEGEGEPIEARLNTLKAVFQAIQDRAAQGNAECSKIRSLTICNLQNVPHHDFVSSSLFKDIAKDIERLHLLVVEEYNEHGPDRDVFVQERLEYERHLQNDILPHFAENLTALSLFFREPWGAMPGHFDGGGLVFPRLKTLNLGNFVIKDNSHFDWVLSQKSLETLRMDSCYILSYLHTDTEHTAKRNLDTKDWQRLPNGSYGFLTEDDDIFSYDGTWEAVFDKIRERLPNLRDLRVDETKYNLNLLQPSQLGTSLLPSRYIAFDIGILPSPWIDTDGEDGKMEFGDNNPNTDDMKEDNGKAGDDDEDFILNRAAETRNGDTRAFNELLEACRARNSACSSSRCGNLRAK
ncbi:hypothetical protein LZ31DRAFT_500783 [Colletotrichum somersetense]|nr:hypothetical protein LZ31DRAFT_500783 [Colletotrichum somersetense]